MSSPVVLCSPELRARLGGLLTAYRIQVVAVADGAAILAEAAAGTVGRIDERALQDDRLAVAVRSLDPFEPPEPDADAVDLLGIGELTDSDDDTDSIEDTVSTEDD